MRIPHLGRNIARAPHALAMGRAVAAADLDQSLAGGARGLHTMQTIRLPSCRYHLPG